MRIGYSNSSGSSNYCRVLFDLAIEFLRLSKPPDILGGIAASVAVLLSGWSLRQIRLCPDWIGSITPSKTHIKTKYRARSELVASFDDRIERFAPILSRVVHHQIHKDRKQEGEDRGAVAHLRPIHAAVPG